MQPESITYHYSIHRPKAGEPGIWPLGERKQHTKDLEYEPDTLAFDIHVTEETHHVCLRTVAISGFRILKDGTTSHTRIHDPRGTIAWQRQVPLWVIPYITAALAQHGYVDRPGT